MGFTVMESFMDAVQVTSKVGPRHHRAPRKAPARLRRAGRAPRLTPDKHESTRRLLQSAHAGDQEAREALVRENLPLVRHLVRRFQDRGREYDDLFQYGCLGLLKAIDRFDPSFGTRFFYIRRPGHPRRDTALSAR